MERTQDVEINRAVMALILSETAHELSAWGRVQASLGAETSPVSEKEPWMGIPVSASASAKTPVRPEVSGMSLPAPPGDPLARDSRQTASEPAGASVRALARPPASPKGGGCFELYRSLHQDVAASGKGGAQEKSREACHAEIRHRIEICRLCALGTKRNGVLCGYGALDAPVMFVGAGGNPHEFEAGRMMTGEASELMDNIIAAMHSCNARITKDNIYYSNIIKCCASPTGLQRASVSKTCVRYLREEVRLVQPKVILIWGQLAYNAMFGDDANILAVRGQVRRFEQIPAVATHHPLECIRSPKLKGPVWHDVRTVLALLKPTSAEQPGALRGETPQRG